MTTATTANTSLSATQAWAILTRHARDEIAPLRLQELCRDNDRVSSLVAVYNTVSEANTTMTDHPESKENRILIADLSRQRMTLETLNHLLKLTTARNLKKFITLLSWGQNNPSQPVLPSRARTKSTRGQHVDAKKTTRFEESVKGGRRRRLAVIPTPLPTDHMPSMHLALRVPAKEGYEMLLQDGSNALTQIHREWDRIERFSDSIRRAQLRGVTGSMIRDVVVIGRGVPMAALQFVYTALLKDERAVLAARAGMSEAATARIRRNLSGLVTNGIAARRLKFLSSIDPIAAASEVADLDPASTLVISIALRGNEETGLTTKTLKSWLLHSLGGNRRPDHILAKHMMLVTGNDHIASIINKPESVFIVPEHSRCEAFTSFSAATLLPLSIVFGWPIVEEFIAGAHDMDEHFVETNPRHNIPVLLALTDIWNDVFLRTSARSITPFTEAFSMFPAFVGALEAQACGNALGRNSSQLTPGGNVSCSSSIIDGGLACAYDRALFQAPKVMNSELITTMDTQLSFNTSRTLGTGMDDINATQDALMCALFAQADELAFGYDRSKSDLFSPSMMSIASQENHDVDGTDGNRPSVLLMCGKLDAFGCGQLVALSEHRAVVKAHLWGIDPFTTEIGSSLRMSRTDQLKEDLQNLFVTSPQKEEDENDEGRENGGLNLSTKTILSHYANLMRDKRKYTVK